MITILGDVGNQGYALPMVQAYPTDLDANQLLGWNPTAQALDYVPYTGNVLGDWGVLRDLSVGRDMSVAGIATFAGKPVFSAGLDSLLVNNAVPASGTITSNGAQIGASHRAVSGANNAELQATKMQVQGLDVVGSRKTGWAAATGTATRTTFATGSVTLPVLAEHVKALMDDLIAHGLIGT